MQLGLQGADPSQIWTSVTQGLLQGVASIGINYATQELGLNPLLANLGFSAISSAINAGIQVATGKSNDFFGSIFKTYNDNALTFLGYGEAPSRGDQQFWIQNGDKWDFNQAAYDRAWGNYNWQQTAYMSQVVDFSDITRDNGLVEALNAYGTSFFNAMAVNNIMRSGMNIGEYFQKMLTEDKWSARRLKNGQWVQQVAVTDAQGEVVLNAFFLQRSDDTWRLIGKEDFISDSTYFSWGTLGVDAYGKIGYTDAEIYSIFDSDIQYQRVVNGQQAYVEIKDLQGNTILLIEPTEAGSYNVYNSYGDYVEAKINTQTYYTFTLKGDTFEYKNLDNGATILFEDNNIVDFSIDNSSGFFDDSDIQTLLSLNDEDKAKVISAFMAFGHGFNKEAVMGGMPNIMQLFANDLIADGVIGQNSAFGITIYEGNIFENGIRWAQDAWFGDNTLTNKVIIQLEACLNSLTLEQRALGITDFTHSGNFRPTIEALNTRTDLNVHTIINYEGPYTGDTLILNPYVDRIINVNGTAPTITVDNPYMFFRWGVTGPYLDVTQLRLNDAPVPLLGNAEFTGVGRTIDNINFEVLGARHSDFSHDSGDATNIATNIVMRELTDATVNDYKWNKFINTTGVYAVSYDESKKVWNYRIDPIIFAENYEE